jgi:ribosomal protein S18 acetylase RimI-like enzyme
VLPSHYELTRGSGKDRALLIKFFYLTYQELFPTQQDFSHLATTVENYFSRDTPLWWVMVKEDTQGNPIPSKPVGVCWLGNAIDQVSGDRYAYIFLLYVSQEHRRQGIAKALIHQAQSWAKARGDRQIGLQVFYNNQPALSFYRQLGYQTQSFLMLKPLT